jgi:hypothetical protein
VPGAIMAVSYPVAARIIQGATVEKIRDRSWLSLQINLSNESVISRMNSRNIRKLTFHGLPVKLAGLRFVLQTSRRRKAETQPGFRS